MSENKNTKTNENRFVKAIKETQFFNVSFKRLLVAVLALVVMGWCLSFLNRLNFGTDPLSMFNLAVSARIGWTFGNWQAFINCLMFIPIFIFARDQIGWGTVLNMLLVGYSHDFFVWLNDHFIPTNIYGPEGVLWIRILIAIPTLAIFVVAVSAYIAVQLGTSPYDALPYLLHRKIKKVPFKWLRMAYDVVFVAAGYLLGGPIGFVTIIVAATLGPVISFLTKKFEIILK